MMLKCECALHLAVDIVYSVLYGLDLFSSIIRDFDVEFFFKCHDQFNDIQGISAEVIDESGVDGDISFAHFVSTSSETPMYCASVLAT